MVLVSKATACAHPYFLTICDVSLKLVDASRFGQTWRYEPYEPSNAIDGRMARIVMTAIYAADLYGYGSSHHDMDAVKSSIRYSVQPHRAPGSG